jgi:hypothetical protein
MAQQSLNAWLTQKIKKINDSVIVCQQENEQQANEAIQTQDDKDGSGEAGIALAALDPMIEADESSASDDSDSETESELVDEKYILGEKAQQHAREKRSVAPGPIDLSQLPTDVPTQPLMRNYPAHIIGHKARRFNRKWYDEHKWLEYSISTDAAYCSVCRHFAGTGILCSDTFIKTGFRSWNRGTGDSKTNAFLIHKNSECHVTALAKKAEFLSMSATGQTVLSQIDKGHANRVLENRYYIKSVIEVIRLICTQNVSLRGHDEALESTNRGNFLEIMNLLASKDKVIDARLNGLGVGNAKYTHHSIQNALINIIADTILNEIKNEILTSAFYSIIADETKDLSKIEQLSVVLRYVYQGVIHEEFVGFTPATALDAASLSSFIINSVSKLGISMANCIAQAYDGASVMSGMLSGVQARIRELVEWAMYVHCYAHRINLVVVDVCKSVKEAGDFFAILQRLYNFISGSYVHVKWLDLQLELYETERPVELKKLSDTRWASQIVACDAVSSRFSCILQLLDVIQQETNSDRACEARALSSLMDFNFVFNLVIFTDILKLMKNVSDQLQSKTLQISHACELVRTLSKCFTDMRNELQCSEYVKTAVELCHTNGIHIRMPVEARRRKVPRKIAESVVTEPVGLVESAGDEKVTLTTNTRQKIYFPILDRALRELDLRFSSSNVLILSAIDSFVPNSDKFLDLKNISPFAQHYKTNMRDLEIELKQLQRLVERKKESNEFSVTNLLEMLQFVQHYEDAFYETKRLLQIASSIPVTSAEAERTFSCLKLIKTHLRTTMSDMRLSNIAVISVHAKRAKNLNLEKVIDLFIEMYPNCRIALK